VFLGGETEEGSGHKGVRTDIDGGTALRRPFHGILDRNERIYSCVCGDPVEAHKKGCADAARIFGVHLDEPADIVLAESYPADLELWQAMKGLYAEDLAMKDGGISILVSPCSEGIRFSHKGLAELGYHPFDVIREKVERGELTNLVLAAHSVHGGRIIKERGRGILVSPGIVKEATEKLGFIWAATPRQAMEKAMDIMGKNASVAVLRSAGDILPMIG